MVRAKDSRAPIARMLVQSMYSGLIDNAGRVADEKIVEHQPGQSVEGVPPRGRGRRHSEREARFAQKLPGRFVAPAPQVEVGSQNHGLIR